MLKGEDPSSSTRREVLPKTVERDQIAKFLAKKHDRRGSWKGGARERRDKATCERMLSVAT